MNCHPPIVLEICYKGSTDFWSSQGGNDGYYGHNGRVDVDSMVTVDMVFPQAQDGHLQHTIRSQTTDISYRHVQCVQGVLLAGFLWKYSESCRLSGVDNINFGCNLGANTVETMDIMDKNVDFHWKLWK